MHSAVEADDDLLVKEHRVLRDRLHAHTKRKRQAGAAVHTQVVRYKITREPACRGDKAGRKEHQDTKKKDDAHGTVTTCSRAAVIKPYELIDNALFVRLFRTVKGICLLTSCTSCAERHFRVA
jgi:hypothetical protein